MHYTTEETSAEIKAVYPEAKPCPASGRAFGKTQREKIEKIYDDICEAHRRAPLDAVLVLGDLSVDDYDFRQLPHNYCQRFKEECMDRLPVKAYAMPGNHDSYPNSIWREVFGYDRQYAVAFGDTVFLMADTFADTPASKTNPGGGAPHTPLDETFLRQSLEAYSGKTIFLCAHHFRPDMTFSEGAKQLIKDSEDIVCLFRGHTHVNDVIDLGEEMGSKRLVDIGGYGYSGRKVGDKWEFNIFDFSWAWGYQIVEIYDDGIQTYHIKTENLYRAVNGDFQVNETVEGAVALR